MFVTDSVVLTYLAGVLKQSSSTILGGKGAFWAQVVATRHQAVYNDLVQALAGRGYVLTQILGWDAGPTYETVITAYWCLLDNVVLSKAGSKFITKAELYLDSLRSLTITIAGAAIDPLGTAGQASGGAINAEAHWHVPGEPHRWS